MFEGSVVSRSDLARPPSFDAKGIGQVRRLVIDPNQDGWEVVVLLNEDSQFAFDLGDPYWARLLARGFVYEPEVERVLRAFADAPYTFVDAGANLGYWSILVSSRASSGAKASPNRKLATVSVMS